MTTLEGKNNPALLETPSYFKSLECIGGCLIINVSRFMLITFVSFVHKLDRRRLNTSKENWITEESGLKSASLEAQHLALGSFCLPCKSRFLGANSNWNY